MLVWQTLHGRRSLPDPCRAATGPSGLKSGKTHSPYASVYIGITATIHILSRNLLTS